MFSRQSILGMAVRSAMPNALKYVIAGLLLVALIAPLDCGASGKTVLIEFGWDIPTTAFVRANIGQMDTIPFDGVAIRVMSDLDCTDDLGFRVFCRTKFSPGEYANAILNLRSVGARRLTHNFIMMCVIPDPADPGWFDSGWSAVAFNAGCMAKIAKQGKCEGLIFDPEPYGGVNPWSYEEMPDTWKAGHTFSQVAAMVRIRGRQFMVAINAQYKDVTLLCLFGPSITTFRLKEDGEPLAEQKYGLLPAFFDGMCEAATDGTTIVDGREGSYGYRDRSRYAWARQRVIDAKMASANPQAYQNHMRVGFPVWLDCRSSSIPWDSTNFANNYYAPEQFRDCLTYALELSSKYVWVS